MCKFDFYLLVFAIITIFYSVFSKATSVYYVVGHCFKRIKESNNYMPATSHRMTRERKASPLSSCMSHLRKHCISKTDLLRPNVFSVSLICALSWYKLQHFLYFMDDI